MSEKRGTTIAVEVSSSQRLQCETSSTSDWGGSTENTQTNTGVEWAEITATRNGETYKVCVNERGVLVVRHCKSDGHEDVRTYERAEWARLATGDRAQA